VIPERLQYDPKNILRAKITIKNAKTFKQDQPSGIKFMQVKVSPIFRHLGFNSTTSEVTPKYPPTLSSDMGSMEFTSPLGDRFVAVWSPALSTKLQIHVSTYTTAGTVEDSSDRTKYAPLVDLQLEFSDDRVTLPPTELCKSDEIELPGPEGDHLRVWVSVSREVFIGKSRFELDIHGKVSKHSQRQRKRKSLS
jgi:hypothetical protein